MINDEPLIDVNNLCNKMEACDLHYNENEKENIGMVIEKRPKSQLSLYYNKHFYIFISLLEDIGFYTPPSSPMSSDNSDDEMELADEGPTIFIEW